MFKINNSSFRLNLFFLVYFILIVFSYIFKIMEFPWTFSIIYFLVVFLIPENILRIIAIFFKIFFSFIFKFGLISKFLYSCYRIKFYLYEEFFEKNPSYIIYFIALNLFIPNIMFVVRVPLFLIVAFGNFFSLLIALYAFLEKNQPLVDEKKGYQENYIEIYTKNLESIYMFLGLNDQRRNFHITNVAKVGADSSNATDKAIQLSVDTAKKYPRASLATFGVIGSLFIAKTVHDQLMQQQDINSKAAALKLKTQAEVQALNAKTEYTVAKTQIFKKYANTMEECLRDAKCTLDKYKLYAEGFFKNSSNSNISQANSKKASGESESLKSPLESGDNFDLALFSKKFFVKFLENFKDFM